MKSSRILVAVGIVALIGVRYFHPNKVQPSPKAKESNREVASVPRAADQSRGANSGLVQTHSKSSSPNTPAISFEQKLGAVDKEVDSIEKCYGDDCTRKDLSGLEGKDRAFEAGKNLTLQLRDLLQSVSENEIVDPRVTELALKELRNSDGFVQEACLDLLATQAPSADVPSAIIANVFQGSDAELIEQGLLELSRYTATNGREIETAVGEAMQTGSPFVAQKVADNVLVVLDRQNAKYFSDLAQTLDPQSRVRSTLLGKIAQLD